MKHFLTIAALLLAILPANAIIWKYGEYNTSKKQCTLTGWGGTQPSSGKLAIPASYKHTDGVTYKVVTIAPHALDNLTTVTEISIPASVTLIGDAKTNSYPSDPLNFGNCPALKKFIVDSGNKYFSAIDGMLYVDGKYLLSVPQALTVSGGALTLPSTTTYISASAFAGNTTVTTLTLPRRCNINDNGGLNRAKAIKTYKLTGSSGSPLVIVDGMLLDSNDWLISCPPAMKAASLTVPSSVSRIKDYAFANTTGVKSIDLSAVSKIGNRAFTNSGLTHIDIPGSVTTLGEGTFAQSKSLTSIHLESVDMQISEHFAEGCDALTRVTTENPLKLIEGSAFKNCSSLTEFPFSSYTEIPFDSVFYGCGFTKVVFDNERMRESISGSDIFSMCSQLEEIDASAITGTDEVSFLLPYDFANGCYNLKTLKLPPFTSITDMSSTSTPPIFGYTCLLDHIEMHTITPVVDLPRFCYSTYKGVQVFSPQVYISVTANSDLFPTYYNDWPVGPMFVAGNGATVKPQFYCDAYTPSENYVCNTATYNIPGGAMHNYSEARNAGCTVRETYSVEFQNVNDYMRVVISRKADAPADVREFYVSFDGGTPKRIGYEGSAVSDTSYDDIRKIRISYRLNDIEMATDYPMGHWTGASVDGIEIDEDDTEAVYYNLQGIRIDNPGNGLYIRRTAKGSDVVRL